MPKTPVSFHGLFERSDTMTDTTSIEPKVVAFVQQRELAVAKDAVKALHDCLALKRELKLPVLDQTRQAIQELEDGIHSLKVELLRSHHPDQLELPLDLPAKEGKHEAGHNDASCPALGEQCPGFLTLLSV